MFGAGLSPQVTATTMRLPVRLLAGNAWLIVPADVLSLEPADCTNVIAAPPPPPGVTEMLVEPVIVPDVAVIVVEPVPTAVASPLLPAVLLIVATPVADELQVTVVVTFWKVPSLNDPVAVNC